MNIYNEMDFQHKGKLSSVVLATLKSNGLKSTAVLMRVEHKGTCCLSSPSCARTTSDSSICLQHTEQTLQNLIKTIIISKRHQVLTAFLSWHSLREVSFNLMCQHWIFLPISKYMSTKQSSSSCNSAMS